jgi:hypothetical protein
MWWCEQRTAVRLLRLAVVLTAAGLVAGCFQPLYGRGPSADVDSVHDKLGEIDIPTIAARQGTSVSRLAVGMRNALQYDFNGGAGANAPTHRLVVILSPSATSVVPAAATRAEGGDDGGSWRVSNRRGLTPLIYQIWHVDSPCRAPTASLADGQRTLCDPITFPPLGLSATLLSDSLWIEEFPGGARCSDS